MTGSLENTQNRVLLYAKAIRNVITYKIINFDNRILIGIFLGKKIVYSDSVYNINTTLFVCTYVYSNYIYIFKTDVLSGCLKPFILAGK